MLSIRISAQAFPHVFQNATEVITEAPCFDLPDALNIISGSGFGFIGIF